MNTVPSYVNTAPSDVTNVPSRPPVPRPLPAGDLEEYQ